MTPSQFISCSPRLLPRSDWARAARNAIDQNAANRPLGVDDDELSRASEGDRLAVDVTRYWGSGGVHLTVGFIDTPDRELRDRIVAHLNAWGETATVEFRPSDREPQVRIARWTPADSPGDEGYWSNLGTDILLIDADRPTMNLEAFTMATPDSEFYRVVRHEAGHTLGFPHEHMRQAIVQRLDREKVIRAYMASQGWSPQEVIDQVLTPLEESSILGTPTAEEDSIMCYQIPGFLTTNGEDIAGGSDITPGDRAFVAQIYPKQG
ncbi:hypothetical protein ACWEOH_15750 [Agromyces sp. NPDC004153]